jgi:thioredoxin 2
MSKSIAACPSCGTRNRLPEAANGSPRCASCKEPLPWLVNSTDATFQKAVDTDQLVLVDLWAPWCGPCRMVAPVLEKLSNDMVGQVKVVKVNVDENPMVAHEYNARSIPMLLFMRNGELVDTVIGAQPEHLLRGHIDKLLAAV